MHPTWLGIKALVFYAVVIGAFFAAPYMNLFFLALAFLSVVGALTVLWTWRNVAGIRGALLVPEPIAANCPGMAVVELDGGRRRRLGLTGTVRVAGQPVRVATVAVLEGRMRCEAALPCYPRGIWPLARAQIESAFPLGMVRAWRRLQAPAAIAVYPAPIALGAAHTRAAVLAELLGAPVDGAEDTAPAGLRAYREGDEMRHVHWKASARRGALVVCEREQSARSGLEVQLDRRAERKSFEAALSTLTALALWARQHQELLVVRSQGHCGTYGAGHLPWHELLRWMAAVAPLPPAAEPPPPSPAALRLPAASGADRA